MPERARPPDDITPREFFTRWIPDTVAGDHDRRRRLGDTRATIVFVFAEETISDFTVHIADGTVHGIEERHASPDLEVRVDETTWRKLNRGELSAPEAALRRRVRLSGDLVLALKLHLILG